MTTISEASCTFGRAFVITLSDAIAKHKFESVEGRRMSKRGAHQIWWIGMNILQKSLWTNRNQFPVGPNAGTSLPGTQRENEATLEALRRQPLHKSTHHKEQKSGIGKSPQSRSVEGNLDG
jgi:hypothetical protein